MVYKIGAVGLGHWFHRLWYGLKETSELKIAKAAAVSDVFSKRDALAAVGLTEKEYFRVFPGEPLADEFFEGLDVVHISNPNEFHSAQTIQSLQNGKFVIVEKTWGVNKREFDKVVGFLMQNNYEKKVYLHLHYLHKQLTAALPALLEKYTAKYGKVTNVHLTFFERKNEEDERRKAWLFSNRNGSLFMDWIHPFEVLVYGAKADRISIRSLELYEVNRGYNTVDPTGIYASIDLSGKYFASKAIGELNIAKGVSQERHTKRVRFYFGNKAYLELNYLDSEVEFAQNKFGNYQLIEQKDGKKTVLERNEPTGKNTAQLFVADILELCKGNGVRFGIEEMLELFKPQWEYQRIAKDKKLIIDQAQIEKFLLYGFDPTAEAMEERIRVPTQKPVT